MGGFLKGNKLPLGDGVDQNDKAVPRPRSRTSPRRRRASTRSSSGPSRRTRRSRRPRRVPLGPDATGGRGIAAPPAPRSAAASTTPPEATTHAPHPHQLRRDLRRRAPRLRSSPRAAARRPAASERRAALPPAPTPDASTDQRIARPAGRPSAPRPSAPTAATLLAGAYLQKVRETGDAGFYDARRRAPSTARSRCAPHDAGALTAARRARALAPRLPRPACATRCAPARWRPTVDRAVRRRRRRARRARALPAGRARAAGDGRPQAQPRRLRARVLLPRAARRPRRRAGRHARGRVGRRRGARERRLRARAARRPRAAARPHRRAPRASTARRSHGVPGYPAAEAGLAQADVARGRPAPARSRRLQRVVDRLPLPELRRSRWARRRAAAGPRARRAARPSRSCASRRCSQQRAGVNADVELAALRGRPRQPAPRRGARPPSLGGGAERSLGRRPGLGAAPRRATARRARVGAARAGPRLARPGLPDPRGAHRAQRRRAAPGGALAGAARAARSRRAAARGLREALR